MPSYAHTVLWVVGEPGIGKTTFCRKLLASYGPWYAANERPKWSIFGVDTRAAAAVGTWKGAEFDGGDTVPPSDIKPAIEFYVRELRHTTPFVLFDGDKFANKNALAAVACAVHEYHGAAGRLTLVHIVGPRSAAEGRAIRAARVGRAQNESWVNGRRTKAARFAELFRKMAPAPSSIITIDRDSGDKETIEECQSV